MERRTALVLRQMQTASKSAVEVATALARILPITTLTLSGGDYHHHHHQNMKAHLGI